MNNNRSKSGTPEYLDGYTAASQGTIAPANGLDCRASNGALIDINVGAIVSTSVVTANIQMSADNVTFVDAYDEKGNQITNVIGESYATGIARFELYALNPDYPYIGVEIVIGTANATINGIQGETLDERKQPVAANSNYKDMGVWNGTFTS